MITRFLLVLLRIYSAAISPLTVGSCRFQPTCSQYAREAIETHGALKGSGLALKRLLKCHPFNKSPQNDPVPD